MSLSNNGTFRKHARSITRRRVRLTGEDPLRNERVSIDAVTRDISESGFSIDKRELGCEQLLLDLGRELTVDFYAKRLFPKSKGAKVVRADRDQIAMVFE